MNINCWVLLFVIHLILLPPFINAQDPHQYFPHHVGDTWFYIDRNSLGNLTTQVLRDSVDEEGSLFLHNSDFWIWGSWWADTSYWSWKVSPAGDSVTLLPFSRNLLYYKFPMEVGDTWALSPGGYYARVIGKSELNLWGKVRTVFDIVYYPDSTLYQLGFLEGYAIGLGTFTYFGNPFFTWGLAGCIIDGDTIGNILRVPENENLQPVYFKLYQNYPNPFNPSTNIDYEINELAKVTIKVYDILGNEVTVLVNEEKHPGKYSVKFNAGYLSSGVYFYKLQSGGNIMVKSMVLIE